MASLQKICSQTSWANPHPCAKFQPSIPQSRTKRIVVHTHRDYDFSSIDYVNKEWCSIETSMHKQEKEKFKTLWDLIQQSINLWILSFSHLWMLISPKHDSSFILFLSGWNPLLDMHFVTDLAYSYIMKKCSFEKIAFENFMILKTLWRALEWYITIIVKEHYWIQLYLCLLWHARTTNQC